MELSEYQHRSSRLKSAAIFGWQPAFDQSLFSLHSSLGSSSRQLWCASLSDCLPACAWLYSLKWIKSINKRVRVISGNQESLWCVRWIRKWLRTSWVAWIYMVVTCIQIHSTSEAWNTCVMKRCWWNTDFFPSSKIKSDLTEKLLIDFGTLLRFSGKIGEALSIVVWFVETF